jgi:hypothetical protein
MGCGCQGGKRDVRGNSNPVVLNTMSSNRRIVAAANNQLPSVPVSENLGTTNVLDQDRLRIERLRREAQRRSLGR